MDTEAAIAHWELEPHPEGGHYRRTYASPLTTTPAGWPGPRSLATAILYLLPAGERSTWHRVRGEELWLWQGGAAMELSIGDEPVRRVGPAPHDGEELQVLVPSGAWQSATPAADPWSLVACVVVPGFDWTDFELRD